MGIGGLLDGWGREGVGEEAIAFARLVDVEAGGIVEDEFFVAFAGTLGVVEAVFVELGEEVERIVGQEVVGIEVDELLEEGVGFGVALLADADARFLVEYFVEKGMGECAVGDVVEGMPGGVEEVAVEQEVGSGIAGKHVEGAVVLHVVADEEGELHGVVGDEFGGGGAEDVELGFGPEEVVVVVGEFGILEFGKGTQDVVFVGFFDLHVEEGGIPDFASKEEEIGQGEFGLVAVFGGEFGEVEDVVKDVGGGLDTVGMVGKEVGVVAHELDGAGGFAQLDQGGTVVAKEPGEELVFDGEMAV